MKRKNLIMSSLLVLIIVMSGCSNNSEKQMEKAEWIIGTWENKTEIGNVYEVWEKLDSNEFSAKSYIITESNDTVILETIKLLREGDKIIYIPTVDGENDNLPIRFIAESVSEDKLVFKNTEHDFPHVISYTKTSEDSLYAEISGRIEGIQRKQGFLMNRIR